MTNTEEKLFQCSREIRESYLLKKDERVRISENILSHHAVGAAVPSAYKKVRFPHFFFMNYASLTAVFVFVFAGVLSYAAEQSLPGDPLYAVKTNVNENIQSLLTFSPESKAELQVTLTKKRVGEAEALIATDKMSTTTEAALSSDFKDHLDSFKDSIDQVGASGASLAALQVADDDASTSASSTAMADTANLTPDQLKVLAYSALEDVSVAIDDLDGFSVFATSTAADAVTASSTATSTDLVASSTATSTDISQTSSSPAAVATSSNDAIFAIADQITDAESIVSIGINVLQQGDYLGAYEDFEKALAEIRQVKASIIAEAPVEVSVSASSTIDAASSTPETSTSTATTTAQ